jgi:hypothetical protein
MQASEGRICRQRAAVTLKGAVQHVAARPREIYGFDQRPIQSKKKVGRNDPCPCGSGKKHKKCCLN